ncbi:MAG TPA: type II toxin-antitoxin system VapC family toxin [Solirubrobacteraceae bacterium]|nr:type II toxin-antitoxin system VapC family toxin [Solirubrobacteraceae bacterium]
MLSPDVNVLINAVNIRSPHHKAATAWIESKLSGAETVGFAMVTLMGFVRISTNPRVFTKRLQPAQALDQVDAWLARKVATVIHPGPRHLELFRSLIEHTGTAGNLTTDAHLAALAIEQRATLATFDGDFHRFPSLKLDYLQ